MRRDAFDHLLQLDHTYYNNTKVGTIMGRITNDLFDVTEFAHHCPEEFFIAAIKIVVSFIILCRASVPLTLAVFACVPLMGVVSVYLNGRLRARFRQQRVHPKYPRCRRREYQARKPARRCGTNRNAHRNIRRWCARAG